MYLILADNQISDITPLNKLTKLKMLWFQHNQISDISIVENFKNLTHLHIKGNPIRDMTPIRRLRKQIPHLELNTENIYHIY